MGFRPELSYSLPDGSLDITGRSVLPIRFFAEMLYAEALILTSSVDECCGSRRFTTRMFGELIRDLTLSRRFLIDCLAGEYPDYLVFSTGRGRVGYTIGSSAYMNRTELYFKDANGNRRYAGAIAADSPYQWDKALQRMNYCLEMVPEYVVTMFEFCSGRYPIKLDYHMLGMATNGVIRVEKPNFDDDDEIERQFRELK